MLKKDQEEVFPPGKYKATVCRITYSHWDFKYESDQPLTEGEFNAKFEELAYDENFPNPHSVEYEVQSLNLVEE